MRSRLLLIAVLAVALAAAAQAPARPAATAGGAPLFVLTGGGWGHNVGLSQWGAYGQAVAGRPYDRILAHYYPGTALTPAPVQTVRVLVAEGSRGATIAAAQAFQVQAAGGRRFRLADTEVRLAPGPLRARVLVDGASPASPPRAKTVRLPLPLTFLPAPGSPLTLDGKGFRGRLVVSRAGTGLRVVMSVSLDAYVMGIVPGEMPREWPLEALKTQAVAARTYAVANLERGKEWDVVADPVAFAYYGVGAESRATTRAVRQTRGQVLTYNGKVITAFYFSSSGGRTMSSQDVFGHALPYLPGSADPWDEPSPHHRWEPRTFTAETLARALGARGAVTDVRLVPSAPGRPLAFRLAGPSGGETLLRASDIRTRLGLKSPNFQFGVLRLDPFVGAAPPTEPVTLTGLARGVGTATLEQRRAAGVWKPVQKLALRSDGSFAVVVEPGGTTAYRVSAAGLIGPQVVVRVAKVQP
jgi:SpoIID/LytB domain protein